MYRQVSVSDTGEGTPVQDPNDPRPYQRAVLTIEGSSVRIVPGEGTDPVSSTFGQTYFASAGGVITGAGNIRLARMLALDAGGATVGIDLQVH